MFRSLCCAVLAFAVLTGFPVSLQAAKAVAVAPKGGTPVKVMVGKKEKLYHTFPSAGRLSLEVSGPGSLTVISRVTVSRGSAEPIPYTVVVREKGKTVVRRKSAARLSDATVKGSEMALGKMRKFLLRVPPGTHVYEVSLEEAGGKAAAMKFVFRPGKRPHKMVWLEARSYNRVATAVVKEKLHTCYVSTKDKGVQLRVIGPTRLRITTRLNYDPKMTGRQKFGIGVWEKDKRIVLKSLVASKSLGATYQDWKDVIPGKTATFSVTVPSGEHWYTFRLEEGVARSVSMRFSIPKKHLKNEK